ncbi:hypothetical protein Bbelb_307970 [Branchiostoma belcheri]|nr:hypothetical protein Bbelb_307970 [Branchiostoma belcheri]
MQKFVCSTLLVLCVLTAGAAGFELADMISRLQRQNAELTETVANLTAALEAAGPDRVQGELRFCEDGADVERMRFLLFDRPGQASETVSRTKQNGLLIQTRPVPRKPVEPRQTAEQVDRFTLAVELETENSVLQTEKTRLQREISGLQERIEDIELMYQTLQRRAAGSAAGTVHVSMTTQMLYAGLSAVVLLTRLSCSSRLLKPDRGYLVIADAQRCLNMKTE